MKRCLAEGIERFELLVGAAVLANNLMRIASWLMKRTTHCCRRRVLDNPIPSLGRKTFLPTPLRMPAGRQILQNLPEKPQHTASNAVAIPLLFSQKGVSRQKLAKLELAHFR
jgi:hypothetical protein